MPLNNLTIREAIEIAIMARDKLPFDYDLPLTERWKEKKALAIVHN